MVNREHLLYRQLLSHICHIDPGANLIQPPLCYELVRNWSTGIRAMQDVVKQ